MRACHQINLQRQFGGGEVYAAFVARALAQLGRPSTLFVHPQADFWPRLLPDNANIIAVADYGDIQRHLPDDDVTVLCHAAAPDAVQQLGAHRLACFAHMPAHGRKT